MESLEVVKQLSPWCGIGYSKPYALRHPSLNRMCLPFHQSRISNLHCELYHTLLHLSRGFWNFYGRGLISMGRNKCPNKKPLQACLSFLSLEERYRSQQSFLVVRTLICFQQASSLFPELSNNVKQTTMGWCKMSESNCSSCSQNKGATITLHPAYKRHYRSSHGIFFQI